MLLHRLLLSFTRRFEIVAVENGVEALALTAVRTVALVITDYHMPGMNGVQLTGAIKAASPVIGNNPCNLPMAFPVCISGKF